MKVTQLINEYSHSLVIANSVIANSSQKSYSKIDELSKEFDRKVRLLKNVEPEVLEGLLKVFRKLSLENYCKDAYDWLFVAYCHPSKIYIPVLCDLLNLEKVDCPNETIVEIMEELKCKECFPVLKKTLNTKLSYDPDEQLALKILDALVEIDELEAIQVLKECLNSPSYTIREEAELLLEDIQAG